MLHSSCVIFVVIGWQYYLEFSRYQKIIKYNNFRLLKTFLNLRTYNYQFFYMFYNIKSYFRCYPRLNEGDQVVLINDRDVSQHTHDQVVNFIRASSEPHSAQLILAVRQVRKKVHPSVQGAAIVLAPPLLHCYVVERVPILMPHPVILMLFSGFYKEICTFCTWCIFSLFIFLTYYTVSHFELYFFGNFFTFWHAF